MSRFLLFVLCLPAVGASRLGADEDNAKPPPDVPFPYTVKLKPGAKQVVPLELGSSRIKWTVARVVKGKLEPIRSERETYKIKDAGGDEVELPRTVYAVSADWKVVLYPGGKGARLEIELGQAAKESEFEVVIRETSTFNIGPKPPDRIARFRLRVEKGK